MTNGNKRKIYSNCPECKQKMHVDEFDRKTYVSYCLGSAASDESGNGCGLAWIYANGEMNKVPLIEAIKFGADYRREHHRAPKPLRPLIVQHTVYYSEVNIGALTGKKNLGNLLDDGD